MKISQCFGNQHYRRRRKRTLDPMISFSFWEKRKKKAMKKLQPQLFLTVPRPPRTVPSEDIFKRLTPLERKVLSGRPSPAPNITGDIKLLQNDKFTKVQPLGSGAYGQVYRAKSKQFGDVHFLPKVKNRTRMSMSVYDAS
jgi:hypothetical protein